MQLILMGLRGAGKSTLGRRLSALTGSVFVDLDDWTARQLGEGTVGEAWRVHGEDAFRCAEVECLRRALEDRVPILALGGGTPTAPGAEALLSTLDPTSRLVYLRAPAHVLAARIRGAGGRPSLTGADAAEEVPVVLARRDPLYTRLAHLVLDVDAVSEVEAAAELLRIIQS